MGHWEADATVRGARFSRVLFVGGPWHGALMHVPFFSDQHQSGCSGLRCELEGPFPKFELPKVRSATEWFYVPIANISTETLLYCPTSAFGFMRCTNECIDDLLASAERLAGLESLGSLGYTVLVAVASSDYFKYPASRDDVYPMREAFFDDSQTVTRRRIGDLPTRASRFHVWSGKGFTLFGLANLCGLNITVGIKKDGRETFFDRVDGVTVSVKECGIAPMLAKQFERAAKVLRTWVAKFSEAQETQGVRSGDKK